MTKINWYTEDQQKLQDDGKCGYRKGDGHLCTNPIADRIELEEGEVGSETLGVCGVHFKGLLEDIERDKNTRMRTMVERFEEIEGFRIFHILKRWGLDVRKESNYSYRGPVKLNNPGQLVEMLVKAGVMQRELPPPDAPPSQEWVRIEKGEDECFHSIYELGRMWWYGDLDYHWHLQESAPPPPVVVDPALASTQDTSGAPVAVVADQSAT